MVIKIVIEMPSKKYVTTVSLSPETKKLLASIGSKDETYDDIIRRLIDFYNSHRR